MIETLKTLCALNGVSGAPPHHLGDPHGGVVHHHRQLVGVHPVGPSENKVPAVPGQILGEPSASWSQSCLGVESSRSLPRTTWVTPMAASSTTTASW